MIVTVTPNPALDLTYHLDALHVGDTQRVAPARVRAGGKGINVARVLHAQGHLAGVVAPVGGPTGEILRSDLVDGGLRHHLLPVRSTIRRTVAIVTPAETTNLNESGAPLADEEWDALLALAATALAESDGGTRVLVCSGSMPLDAPVDVVARLIRVARDAGAVSIVDTSGPHLLAAAEAGADILKPNEKELHAALPDAGDALSAARALARRSGGVVYASLGADGLLRVPARGGALHGRLRRTLTGNTTGAGDAAVAAIAAAVAAGEDDAATTVRTAVAWSAAAVLHPLAGSIADPAPLLDEVVVSSEPDPKD